MCTIRNRCVRLSFSPTNTINTSNVTSAMNATRAFVRACVQTCVRAEPTVCALFRAYERGVRVRVACVRAWRAERVERACVRIVSNVLFCCSRCRCVRFVRSRPCASGPPLGSCSMSFSTGVHAHSKSIHASCER